MPTATSRCRDVCRYPPGAGRLAIVGLDRRHDRFGLLGTTSAAIGSPRPQQRRRAIPPTGCGSGRFPPPLPVEGVARAHDACRGIGIASRRRRRDRGVAKDSSDRATLRTQSSHPQMCRFTELPAGTCHRDDEVFSFTDKQQCGVNAAAHPLRMAEASYAQPLVKPEHAWEHQRHAEGCFGGGVICRCDRVHRVWRSRERTVRSDVDDRLRDRHGQRCHHRRNVRDDSKCVVPEWEGGHRRRLHDFERGCECVRQCPGFRRDGLDGVGEERERRLDRPGNSRNAIRGLRGSPRGLRTADRQHEPRPPAGR